MKTLDLAMELIIKLNNKEITEEEVKAQLKGKFIPKINIKHDELLYKREQSEAELEMLHDRYLEGKYEN